MKKISKDALNIIEADGLEFAQRKEAGEDIKVGDGEEILKAREEKKKEEEKEAEVATKDDERRVPESPTPQDMSNVDVRELLNIGKSASGETSIAGSSGTADGVSVGPEGATNSTTTTGAGTAGTISTAGTGSKSA